METRIALKYVGPAVESGSMDVYEAAANMIAFSEFVVQAAKIEYGEAVDAKAEVAGFSRGSFITDIVINVAGATAPVFSGISPKQILEIVKESVQIWRHLRGSPPSKIEPAVGQHVNVTNNNGQVLTVNAQSLTLVFSEQGSEAVGKFINQALAKPGMDAVEITSKSQPLETVTQAESVYFVPVAPSQTVTDVTVRMALMVEAPVFKDGNKWRFSDGQQSFFAEIADADFVARVNAGERFGKGDILTADVRISQEQSGMKLSADRTLIKIHEHKVASQQLSIY